MKRISFIALCVAIGFTSCKKDEEVQQCNDASTDYSRGAYVVNQGAFQANNASLTYSDNSGNVTESVFSSVNGVDLGDVAQSFGVANGHGFAVVNNSFKVEVVNMTSFERVATINDASIDYPRYTVDAGNGKVYLSNGSFAGSVIAIDAESFDILGSVAVGGGPEQMVLSGANVFVANSGGWGLDSTVSVINTANDEVVSTIELSHRPIDLDVDADGNVWALCAGATMYDEEWNVIGNSMAMLHKIDGSSLEVMESIEVGVEGDHPSSMVIDQANQTVLVVNSGVHAISIGNTAGGWTEWSSASYNSVDYNATTETIWATDVPDYTSNEMVHILDLTGNEVSSFEAGIAPTHIVFE